MSAFLERIFGGKDKPPATEKLPASAQKEKDFSLDYNMQRGHAYILLGGKAEDVETTCAGCGGPFKGPCQSNCDWCATSRKVYWADVTDVNFLTSTKDKKIEELSLILPEGDFAKFGKDTNMDTVVAEKVSADRNFRANLVIAKEFNAGWYTRIGTLILVDIGSATLSYNSIIGTLITGKNVGPVEFSSDCGVKKLLTTSGLKYKAGDGFCVGESKTITYADFVEIVSKSLVKRQNRPQINADFVGEIA